ncbi:MAG: hypothetical protein KGI06_05070 [Candidatus Micrarchaeota archaeon]|nr:hypothetical protein [Candidatus Micrarchaeota archaeon]
MRVELKSKVRPRLIITGSHVLDYPNLEFKAAPGKKVYWVSKRNRYGLKANSVKEISVISVLDGAR